MSAVNDLFNALLDISKLDAGALTPEVTDFPLAQLLAHIETTFDQAAQDKGLSFRFVPSRAWVRSDFILLERILLNLVSNAVRYTDRGGIIVGCRRRGARLRIEVWDSGIGIPADQKEKIFGEFYRVRDPDRDARGGLGLGLAIVERLCLLLDHRLEVSSTIGQGSRFAISLPRVPEPQPAIDYAITTQPIADPLAGKLIVVIDDDALVLDGMRGVLRGWGCDVVTAQTCDQVLVSFNGEARTPDAIISDYHLNDRDTGVAIIKRLRAGFGAATPALLITGDISPDRIAEAAANGLHLLHKPVAPMSLRAMLNQLLRAGTSAASAPSSAAASPDPAHRASAETSARP